MQLSPELYEKFALMIFLYISKKLCFLKKEMNKNSYFILDFSTCILHSEFEIKYLSPYVIIIVRLKTSTLCRYCCAIISLGDLTQSVPNLITGFGWFFKIKRHFNYCEDRYRFCVVCHIPVEGSVKEKFFRMCLWH